MGAETRVSVEPGFWKETYLFSSSLVPDKSRRRSGTWKVILKYSNHYHLENKCSSIAIGLNVGSSVIQNILDVYKICWAMPFTTSENRNLLASVFAAHPSNGILTSGVRSFTGDDLRIGIRTVIYSKQVCRITDRFERPTSLKVVLVQKPCTCFGNTPSVLLLSLPRRKFIHMAFRCLVLPSCQKNIIQSHPGDAGEWGMSKILSPD